MNYRDFVNETINTFGEDVFKELKNTLVGEYVSFSIIGDEDITKEILAEKVCDYFEKLEIKTGKSFDKNIEQYISDLDDIVSRRIEKTPPVKKNDTTPVIVCRARKYYEQAISIKNIRVPNTRKLIDFTRIMMCLYQTAIESNQKEIANFDFSAESLKPGKIIASMKNEQDGLLLKIGKKKKFDIKELYCSDTCTFIIVIIGIYTIIDRKIEGEYYHE